MGLERIEHSGFVDGGRRALAPISARCGIAPKPENVPPEHTHCGCDRANDHQIAEAERCKREKARHSRDLLAKPGKHLAHAPKHAPSEMREIARSSIVLLFEALPHLSRL